MNARTPINLLCILILLLLLLGGGSMLYGAFFAPEEAAQSAISVDWRALYPFPDDGADAVPAAPEPAPEQQTLLATVHAFQARLDASREYLLGRQQLLELCGLFRRLTFQTRTDDVVLLNNGYLTTIVKQTDDQTAMDIANSVIAFAESTEAAGTPLLYVQVPQKVCQYDDQMPPGELSYINSNLNNHLTLLKNGGVSVFDLRQALHEDGLSHYGLYFRTDHHWQMSAGLWAARTLAAQLNAAYGCDLDTALLSEDNFSQITYPDWYLGAQGRQVTRGYISPDDFTLLLPNFPTELRVTHPDKGIDVTGDFYETVFDAEMLTTKDYYGQSVYESVLGGNRPLTRITNRNNPDGLRILLVRDSYSAVVAPYLALLCGQVDLIDVRAGNGNFTGSLDAYRDEMQPDLVIVMFCSPVNIDRSQH